ncbi:MAG: SPOR domain-containing protein [Betaproteobacteria bacterium]|nr:SPOR domain-containing protein [Betaproteobacteria bacterium]
MASRDYKTPQKRSRGRSGRSGSTMVIGVAIGLIVGLAIALAVAIYLFNIPAPFRLRDVAKPLPPNAESRAPADHPAAKSPKTSAPAADAPAVTTTSDDKPRFEFYGILAGKEEPVRDRDLRNEKPGDGKGHDAYYLQVGAFQNAAEADNLKARLALAGIEAKIQTAEFEDGKTWHRVRLGPFQSVDEVSVARSRLKENQMSATLLKVQEKRAP